MPDTITDWTLETVPWDDARAVALRAAMDDELGPRYADRLDDLGDIDLEEVGAALAIDPETIVATVIAMGSDGLPVGHAALRDLGDVPGDGPDARGGDAVGALEVKRVYVAPSVRGTGVSRVLMAELERLAAARGVARLILQTGDRQPEAIALYEKIGYTRIATYPPYLAITFSHCFEKRIPV